MSDFTVTSYPRPSQCCANVSAGLVAAATGVGGFASGALDSTIYGIFYTLLYLLGKIVKDVIDFAKPKGPESTGAAMARVISCLPVSLPCAAIKTPFRSIRFAIGLLLCPFYAAVKFSSFTFKSKKSGASFQTVMKGLSSERDNALTYCFKE